MEAPQRAFTPEQVAEQGANNFQYVLFATIAYLKREGLAVEEWATTLGQLFAPQWKPGFGAREFMERADLSVASAGASMRSLSGNDEWAESVVGDWPPCSPLSRDLDLFGLTQADVDPFWEVFRPIAEHLGFEYEWNREAADKLSFTVWRPQRSR